MDSKVGNGGGFDGLGVGDGDAGGGVVGMDDGVVFDVVGGTRLYTYGGDMVSMGEDSLDEAMLIRQHNRTLIRAGSDLSDDKHGLFLFEEESGRIMGFIVHWSRRGFLLCGKDEYRSIFLREQGNQSDHDFLKYTPRERIITTRVVRLAWLALRVQDGVLAKVDSTFVIIKDGNVVKFDVIVDKCLFHP
ncbi:hypothetical protein Tco_1352134 [Tanacetum coccineum]